jgi:hypothetical protein
MKKETLTVEKDEDDTIRYRNAEGELHNPYGPAIVYADGHKEYRINGKLHNENGPAVIWGHGNKEYWIDDHLHNPDGPAVIWDGDKYYWINGNKLTKAEFKSWQSKR